MAANNSGFAPRSRDKRAFFFLLYSGRLMSTLIGPNEMCRRPINGRRDFVARFARTNIITQYYYITIIIYKRVIFIISVVLRRRTRAADSSQKPRHSSQRLCVNIGFSSSGKKKNQAGARWTRCHVRPPQRSV